MKRSIPILIVTAAVLLTAGVAAAQTTGPGAMGYEGSGRYEAPQGEGWFCPYCGSGAWYGGQRRGPGGGRGPGYGYGRGMGPGYGRDMGPGYGHGRGMGPGHGRGPGMMGHGPGMMQQWDGRGYGRGWQGPQEGPQGYAPGRGPGYGYRRSEEPLGKEEARGILERYLETSRNPNLKVGKVEETGDVFEAEIVTRQGEDLVDRVQIDRRTGWMRSVYDR